MYSSTFRKGGGGRSCLYLLVWVSFGSFSLRELTCMHCVYLALWTSKVLCGSFLYAIYKFSFIHSRASMRKTTKRLKCFKISHFYELLLSNDIMAAVKGLIPFVLWTVTTLKKSACVKRRQDCPAGLNALKVIDSFFFNWKVSLTRLLRSSNVASHISTKNTEMAAWTKVEPN